MNRKEAYSRIDAIIEKHEVDDEYVTITSALDYDALRMARKALEQEPKWIPVSEKLPENSGNYLITYCYQGKIETSEAVYVKDEEEDKWYDITDVEITLAVIAWMPLPEPYKAESEG